jgi:carbamoyl-phosphate synthase large subunit
VEKVRKMPDCRNILITGVGGDIGQSVMKCLKETGYKMRLVGCDADPYAAPRDDLETFFQCPLAIDDEGYMAFIDKCLDENDIKYVIPTTEPEIAFYNRYKDRFKNTSILINEPHIINTFFDKYKSVQFFKDNNIAYPRTYRIKEYKNELDFPVLLKKQKTWGSKGLNTVRDKEELEYFKKREKGALIQEIVGRPEEEYTVGVFSDGKIVYSIAFQRCLGYGSLSKIARLVSDEKLFSVAEKMAKAACLKGSFNIQLRKAGDNYIPLEVNPRLSSTVYIRHRFGFEDVKWWLDMKEGRKIEYKPKYGKGVAVRTIGEIFFELR